MMWQDACRIHQLPMSCPLTTAARAGEKAVPTLSKLSVLMKAQGQTQLWWSAPELPVEIDLGKEGAFHSIFSCPVSRTQATVDDPPVLLVCGHAICQSSMANLLRHRRRFKCPTCPVQQGAEDTIALHL